MKGLIVITLSLVALAKCRPDAPQFPPSAGYLPAGPGDHALNFGYGGYDSQLGINNIGQDQKHVYFFAGPDNDQYSRFKINVVPASHKNTKIIFVKAPSHKGIIPEVVAPPSHSEDRTLVYVLVKKPQDGSITVPAGVGVHHTKPQVFFIKYNNKNDAAPQVNAGTQGRPVGSAVSDVGSENAFVNTLSSGIHGSHTPLGSGIHGGHTTLGSHDLVKPGVQTYGPSGVSGPY